MTRSLSRHGLLDLYGCNPALLCDEGRLKEILAAAAEAAQATVLDSRFHTAVGRIAHQHPHLAGIWLRRRRCLPLRPDAV